MTKSNMMFNLNVLMIGTRATGKTTYLTSVYGLSKKEFLKCRGAGTIELDLDMDLRRDDIEKLKGWWNEIRRGSTEMLGTQDRFEYEFMMSYKNDKFLTGDIAANPLLRLAWTDVKGGDYNDLTFDKDERKKYSVDDILQRIRNKECNSLMVFCKWQDVLLEETSEDENEISRTDFINIIESIINIKNNANINLPIVLIVTHCAEEITQFKKVSDAEVKRAQALLNDRRNRIGTVLDNLARRHQKAKFPIKCYYVDSIVSAVDDGLRKEIGLDDVRMPMLSILAQCTNVWADIVEQHDVAPRGDTIGGKSAQRMERLKDAFLRSEKDRLSEAFELAHTVVYGKRRTR